MHELEINQTTKERSRIPFLESFNSRQLSFLDNFGIQVTEPTAVFEIVAISMIWFSIRRQSICSVVGLLGHMVVLFLVF